MKEKSHILGAYIHLLQKEYKSKSDSTRRKIQHAELSRGVGHPSFQLKFESEMKLRAK